MNGPVTARVRPVPHPLRPVPECDRARRHGTLNGEVRTVGLSEPGRRRTTGGEVHRGPPTDSWGRFSGRGRLALDHSAAACDGARRRPRPPPPGHRTAGLHPGPTTQRRGVTGAQPDTPRRWHPGVPASAQSSPQRPGRLQRRPTLPGSVRAAPPTFSPERAAGKGDLGRGRCTAEVNGSGLRTCPPPSRRDVRAAMGACGRRDGTGPHPWCGVRRLSGAAGNQSVRPPATCCGRSTLRSPG